MENIITTQDIDTIELMITLKDGREFVYTTQKLSIFEICVELQESSAEQIETFQKANITNDTATAIAYTSIRPRYKSRILIESPDFSFDQRS